MKRIINWIAAIIVSAFAGNLYGGPPVISQVNLFGGQHRLGLDCEQWTRAGSCSEGIANGVRAQWRGVNAVNWLIGELESRYDAGHRWIWLNRPMGGHPGNNVQGAAWETIPLYKRQQMQNQLKPFLEQNPDLTLGIFIGTQWDALDSLITGDNRYGFDPDIPHEIAAWHAVTDPWHDIGVRWIILDAASNAHKRPWVHRLIEYEAELGRGIKITGEAIPSGPDGLWGSWLALQRFVERNAHTQGSVPQGAEWYIQPSRSHWENELTDAEPTDEAWEAYLLSLMDRGYILSSSHPAVMARALADEPKSEDWHAGYAAGYAAGLVECDCDCPSEPCIDINTASVVELQQLHGIGPTLAERIVRDREENGEYESVYDLTRVSGIGPRTVAGIIEQGLVCGAND
jgi:competence ComEA-like helix-hairpin-helix protein